jgi:hypothetical protein
MNIVQQNQYNQGIGKYKLLSSNAGVGSIVTTKMGYYALISDIMQWEFIKKANISIEKERAKETDKIKLLKNIDIEFEKELGLTRIDDQRFVDFLVQNQALPNLVCLAAVPHLSLNENYNNVNTKSNPILANLGLKANDFVIPATHFPKWFIGSGGELKEYKDWLKLWIDKGQHSNEFAPPRDANKPLMKNGKEVKIKTKVFDNNAEKPTDKWVTLYQELTQTNIILICPNGHLSDVPWSKFIKWKKTGALNEGKNLFSGESCCSSPKLKWTESSAKSEGYSSIFVECISCKQKVNLEGINNLKPNCCGQKPWQVDIKERGVPLIPYEPCATLNQVEQMQIALVTGNNVYYATTFSSLYIPQSLAEGISEEQKTALSIANSKFEKILAKKPDTDKKAWADKNLDEDFIIENDFENTHDFIQNLHKLFLQVGITDENEDNYEKYRWQEYKSFRDNVEYGYTTKDKNLSFKDIAIDERLDIAPYFKKIQKVENLQVSNVLLDFTRKIPNERIVVDGKVSQRTNGQKIYDITDDKLFVLPANEVFGEGIFLDFKDDKIEKWVKDFQVKIKERLEKVLSITAPNSQGAATREKIRTNEAKHFLIHTFAHLLMRELEFTCGYPTASLKERLYISPRMSGVLIYTAEGAEGSMGGLVSQAYPNKINELIKGALQRAEDCSSDPLCWESDGQGIFNQNLAACFSCSLISETACEEFNLGLDRRFLIDSEFGFFRDFI